MTYILAAIILSPVTVVVFAKWMKRRLDRNFPNVENDEDLEKLLAHSLSNVLSSHGGRNG